ncbi:hypothetical protein TC7_025 [Pseudomonas phage TC7]|nr:hypothetical protein TC7_025 [Pseudomonas phage TC7]
MQESLKPGMETLNAVEDQSSYCPTGGPTNRCRDNVVQQFLIHGHASLGLDPISRRT